MSFIRRSATGKPPPGTNVPPMTLQAIELYGRPDTTWSDEFRLFSNRGQESRLGQKSTLKGGDGREEPVVFDNPDQAQSPLCTTNPRHCNGQVCRSLPSFRERQNAQAVRATAKIEPARTRVVASNLELEPPGPPRNVTSPRYVATDAIDAIAIRAGVVLRRDPPINTPTPTAKAPSSVSMSVPPALPSSRATFMESSASRSPKNDAVPPVGCAVR